MPEGAVPKRSRKSVALLKNTLCIIGFLAFAHISQAQAQIDAHYVDEEVTAASDLFFKDM